MIRREHDSENTYNGYVDNPYWWIEIDGHITIGLKDNGEWWGIRGVSLNSTEWYEYEVKQIIDACKLNIKLQTQVLTTA